VGWMVVRGGGWVGGWGVVGEERGGWW
jgi:hypothetical protein